jgi:hypothetical protein
MLLFSNNQQQKGAKKKKYKMNKDGFIDVSFSFNKDPTNNESE